MTILRYLIYPIPTVISCGLFTFNNIHLSQWLDIRSNILAFLASQGPELIEIPPDYNPDLSEDAGGSAL
jgi:hypothetical protein